MRVISTLVWVVITALLVSFVAMNWEKAPVNIWPSSDGYFRFEWPVGFIALFFFLLGLVPTWLLSKAGRWRLHRRINALENTVLAATAPTLGSSTQLDAAAQAHATEHPQN
ncbi:MAG: LapA family protein [Novosphingobium sp.]